MKYLNINQTHLKAVEKYAFMSYEANNLKYEFNKTTDYSYHFLTKLFKKYLHNDIFIDWYK
jgi:hypothetical protein